MNRFERGPDSMWVRIFCLCIGLSTTIPLAGCINPARSSLSPEEIELPSAPMPEIPKGEVYADEKKISSDMRLAPGDTVEVKIRAGIVEDTITSVVRENGFVPITSAEIEVSGLTAENAAERIKNEVSHLFQNPNVQVSLMRKTVTVKRIFVVGDVKKPGIVPMTRGMRVLQAIAEAGNYNETAFLEDIRVIRAKANRSQILSADLARLLTYGDWSRDLPLEENDIVYVPRTRMGDVAAFSKTIVPIVQLFTAPLFTVTTVSTLMR